MCSASEAWNKNITNMIIISATPYMCVVKEELYIIQTNTDKIPVPNKPYGSVDVKHHVYLLTYW